MPFMTPQYAKGPFVYMDMLNGEFQWFPKDLEPNEYRLVEESPEDCWFARLSADGYLDCTDWSGPYKTLEEARNYIRDTWEVDPSTGENLQR